MAKQHCPRCRMTVDPSRQVTCPHCGAELVERRRKVSPEIVRTVMNARGGRFRRATRTSRVGY
jgi:predicted amidophosphoribosyltransferase